uniref:hypothetical protein n=1 Tax=Brevundimonas sp. TaxID=1871086 RepID=UPI0028A0921C
DFILADLEARDIAAVIPAILAGVLFAVSSRFNGSYRPEHFADKDRDGEPDEPGGPAKDL